MNSVPISLVAFFAAASVLTITPGLDTALVLRTAITGDSRAAALAGFGVAVGCFCWASLVALGLGALLTASQLAYGVLRWVGAAYLIWTGYKLLRHPRASFAVDGLGSQGMRSAFRTGALTNLLNPKVGVFYVSFLPQFVPSGVSVAPYILLLGAIHAVLGLIWFACLIMATRPIAILLQRPATIQTCDRLTGALFVAFGAGLAMSSRRT
ncbi:MAG: LysE family translocator [Steroidobacteraceae bacterium]|jgi:threonine/homoserine/homoserine lactone efflux protein